MADCLQVDLIDVSIVERATQGTSDDVPVPAGTEVGDFLYLSVNKDDEAAAYVAAVIEGGDPRWTVLAGGLTDHFWAVATEDDVAPGATIHVAFGPGDRYCVTTLATFRCASTDNPVVDYDTDSTGAGATTHPVPALTAPFGDYLLVAGAELSTDTPGAVTFPDGWTVFGGGESPGSLGTSATTSSAIAWKRYRGSNPPGFDVTTGNAVGSGTWQVALKADVAPQGWDIFAKDALTGPRIGTLQNASGRYLRSVLHDIGEGGFVVNRHALEATEALMAEGNMIKVHIDDCGPDYIDGFFLGPDGDYTLLSARGGKGQEKLTFRGPGALAYLDRARMTPCAFSVDTTVDTWTEEWETTVVPRPSGTAWISTDPDYVYVGSQRSRRIYKVRIADHVVVGVSPVLWAGSTHWLGGLAADPTNDDVLIALETPWIAGSSDNTKVRTIDISGGIATAAVASTIDLGSAIAHSDIKTDGTDLFLSRYSTSAAAHSVYRRNKTTGAVIDSGTVTFGGTVQTKASGISVNGTSVALWFAGTKRALLSTTAAPRTVTGSISTRTIASFGGDWYTSGGDQFFAMVDYLSGTTWLYQLTDNVPQCADASGVFHPEQTSPGALAWRVLVEITHTDRPVQECPELSFDFTETTDSNGTAWPARTSTEEFTWRVGDRAYSDVLARLIPAGVTFDLDVNTMTLHAYVDADFGTDRTSATFAEDKVRFEEGVNLGVNGDFAKRDNRGLPATYITVAGDNGVYGSASLAGPYERSGFMQVSGASTEAVLAAIGADELARQRLVAEALGFEIRWGDPDDDTATQLAGFYIPFKHFRKGDTGTVDMAAGEFTYQEEALRVYGTLISERDGGWRCAVDLGSAYKIPTPITSVGGGTTGVSGDGAGGGASSGGSPAPTPPLYVVDPISGNVIPNVTVLKHDGAYSPTPGTAVLPTPADDDLLVEDLITSETDTTKRLAPAGDGSVEFRQVDVDELATAETDTGKYFRPDGSGGVVADDLPTAGGDGMVPFFIASGDTFTVPEYKQALFAMTIDVEGILDVAGVLIEVD